MMPPPSVVRHSGLQKEVLNLYRSLLRQIRSNHPSAYQDAQLYVRGRFKKRKDWPRRDVLTIEAWIRQGEAQLKLLKSPQTQGLHVYKAGGTKS